MQPRRYAPAVPSEVLSKRSNSTSAEFADALADLGVTHAVGRTGICWQYDGGIVFSVLKTS